MKKCSKIAVCVCNWHNFHKGLTEIGPRFIETDIVKAAFSFTVTLFTVTTLDHVNDIERRPKHIRFDGILGFTGGNEN